jgi:STE24 endopeptidase
MTPFFSGFFRRFCSIALLVFAATQVAAPAFAQAPAAPGASASSAATEAPKKASAFRIRAVDDAWRASLPLDAKAATQAYLDRLPADVVARSNAYFEGRNWLVLWDWLVDLAVAAVMLFTRYSTDLRSWAQRRIKWQPLRDAAYGAVYAAAGWLLTLPLDFYRGYVHEHAYSMSTQTLTAWLLEHLTSGAVGVVLGAAVVCGLYAVLRRAGAQWWLWGTVATMAMITLMVAVAPIWIEPLFNTYKPVPPGPIKTAVLSMAHANGVPVDNVYYFDASRQTTRVSANVTGLFGTAAIRLNDNLLNRSSFEEVRAVMAHEIGHYAMNHIVKMLVMLGVLALFGFLFAQAVMAWLLPRFGTRWHLQGLQGVQDLQKPGMQKPGLHDVATLPLLAVVLGTYFFLATPVLNTITRTQETEADLWGLNLAREPHGEAEVLLKLAEYRKPDPGALEEAIFFTHPSARTRIFSAMRWREQMLGKAASPATSTATPAKP